MLKITLECRTEKNRGHLVSPPLAKTCTSFDFRCFFLILFLNQLATPPPPTPPTFEKENYFIGLEFIIFELIAYI